MKERQRSSVILLGKRHFGQRVGRGTGKLAVAIVVQHPLEIGPRVRRLIQVSITLAEREIGVWSTRSAGIIVEIFLVFGNCQVIELAGEKSIGVLELAMLQ